MDKTGTLCNGGGGGEGGVEAMFKAFLQVGTVLFEQFFSKYAHFVIRQNLP